MAMVTGTLEIRIYAPMCHTLKEKRAIVRSLTDAVRHKFGVAIAEVDDLDRCQSIVLGIACVSNEYAHAQNILDDALRYIESHSPADVVDAITSFV